MIKSKKGFTLIELIVGIAILAVASTMTIVAVFNIIGLFTESNTIKTTTNDIFNSVSTRIGEESPSYGKKIVLTNGSTSLEIPCSTISDENNELTKIKLSYFNPQWKASMLPGEELTEEEIPAISSKIMILDSSGAAHSSDMVSRISVDYQQFSDLDLMCYSEYGTQENVLDGTMINGSYIGPGLKDYIVTPPSEDRVKRAYDSLSDRYKEMLGNSYELRYINISRSVANDGYSNSHVYCYFVPKQKGVYISYETGGIQTNSIWCPITEGDKKIDISAVPIEIKNFFTVSKDGETRVTYKRSDIEHLRFLDDDNISDSETFFAFSNRVK